MFQTMLEVSRPRPWRRLRGGLIMLLMSAVLLAACSSAGDSASDGGASTEAASSASAGGYGSSADAPASVGEAAQDASAGAPSAQNGEELPLAPDSSDRMIVYRGDVEVEVSDFAEASAALQAAIEESGGFLLQFNDRRSEREIGADYTIKVPAGQFMSFLGRLEQSLAHTRFERWIEGTDVTEEYVDLGARLKGKEVEEARLLGFMENAQRAEDLIRISEQLGKVQQEIERIKGRMRYLDQNVAYSTVELRLYEPLRGGPSALTHGKPLGGRMIGALTDSSRALLDIAQWLLVFLAGALPALAAACVIAVPLLWLRRRRRAQAVPPRATPPAGAPPLGGPAGAAEAAEAGGADRPQDRLHDRPQDSPPARREGDAD